MKYKQAILIFFLMTIAVVWFAHTYPLLPIVESYVDPKALGSWVEDRGLFGVFAFIATGALAAAIGLPRQLIAVIAGYSFGLLEGVLLAISSISLGALLTFSFARICARPWVQRRYPVAIAKIDAFVSEQPFLKVLTIRFLPVGTNMLTNLTAGTTKLSAVVFFGASFFGFLPQSTLFVMIGNGLDINSKSQIVMSVVLLLLSSVFALVIYKKHKHHPLR